MPQNKYHWYNWDEYFRGHNVLNCNAVHQQSGPCRKAKNKTHATRCEKECERVLKRLSAREAMRERWLKKISKHYERREPRERKHLKAFMCRDQPGCNPDATTGNPYGEDCRMCYDVMRDTQKEYNNRIRATNKLGLRFEEPRTFAKRTRKEDLRGTPTMCNKPFRTDRHALLPGRSYIYRSSTESHSCSADN